MTPMKRNLLPLSGLLILVVGLPALSSAQGSKRLTVPGINNFWFVDKTVSTGGTIMSRDMAMPALKKRGIKTVINLAGGAQSDAERAATEAAGMKYLVFAINPATLDPSPIEPFLKAASDPANFPVFIHSGNGHRAGMALMIKRVLVDGWTIEKAGIEAAASGLIDDNPTASVWWKFAHDYIMSHEHKKVQGVTP
jgi:protein tyrosine phosphatase (PTP) superfamily phosphohydrolase (DUF442 family)